MFCAHCHSGVMVFQSGTFTMPRNIRMKTRDIQTCCRTFRNGTVTPCSTSVASGNQTTDHLHARRRHKKLRHLRSWGFFFGGRGFLEGQYMCNTNMLHLLIILIFYKANAVCGRYSVLNHCMN